MRIPVIAGNWKLFKKTAAAVRLVQELSPLVADARGVEIVLAPSFTVLGPVRSLLNDSPISIAGQDCFWEDEGAYTGEVSPGMLVDAGCSHVIIGHSERRHFFCETDETVNKKIRAAIRAGLSCACSPMSLSGQSEPVKQQRTSRHRRLTPSFDDSWQNIFLAPSRTACEYFMVAV